MGPGTAPRVRVPIPGRYPVPGHDPAAGPAGPGWELRRAQLRVSWGARSRATRGSAPPPALRLPATAAARCGGRGRGPGAGSDRGGGRRPQTGPKAQPPAVTRAVPGGLRSRELREGPARPGASTCLCLCGPGSRGAFLAGCGRGSREHGRTPGARPSPSCSARILGRPGPLRGASLSLDPAAKAEPARLIPGPKLERSLAASKGTGVQKPGRGQSPFAVVSAIAGTEFPSSGEKGRRSRPSRCPEWGGETLRVGARGPGARAEAAGAQGAPWSPSTPRQVLSTVSVGARQGAQVRREENGAGGWARAAGVLAELLAHGLCASVYPSAAWGRVGAAPWGNYLPLQLRMTAAVWGSLVLCPGTL